MSTCLEQVAKERLLLAARAMLMKADIMLLDEPTNHLDVKNVAWLEEYLTHLPDVTSMVVSHDSGFLDHVCTGIIHYENRKLKHYRVSTDLQPHYFFVVLVVLVDTARHIDALIVYASGRCFARLFVAVGV